MCFTSAALPFGDLNQVLLIRKTGRALEAVAVVSSLSAVVEATQAQRCLHAVCV